MRGIAGKALRRGSIFAALWWVLSEGNATSWSIGGVAVVLATAASLMLVPDALPQLKVLPLLRFIPFFIARSVQGGIDVARRAFQPVPTLAPAFVSYSVTGMSLAERVVFTMICGLLPGTLSAWLRQCSREKVSGKRKRPHVPPAKNTAPIPNRATVNRSKALKAFPPGPSAAMPGWRTPPPQRLRE